MPESSGSSLQVGVRRIDDSRCVVTIRGELNLETAALLSGELHRLVDPDCRLAIIDLSAVPYLDSSGLAVLLALYQRLRKNGGTISIVAPDRGQRRIFETTRLHTILRLFGSEQEALGS